MGYRDGNFRMQVSVSTIGAVGDAVKAAGGEGWDNVDKIIEDVNMNKNLFVYVHRLRLSYGQDSKLFNNGGFDRCEFIFHTTFIEGLRVETSIIDDDIRVLGTSRPSMFIEPMKGAAAMAEVLDDMQTDLDTEIDEEIKEALGSPDAHRPKNIFEENQPRSYCGTDKTCTKCGVKGLHWELLTNPGRWWLHDKKGNSHQCDPFRDKTFLTPEEQELEDLKDVYRVLELKDKEPVKRKEEEFIRRLELD